MTYFISPISFSTAFNVSTFLPLKRKINQELHIHLFISYFKVNKKCIKCGVDATFWIQVTVWCTDMCKEFLVSHLRFYKYSKYFKDRKYCTHLQLFGFFSHFKNLFRIIIPQTLQIKNNILNIQAYETQWWIIFSLTYNFSKYIY